MLGRGEEPELIMNISLHNILRRLLLSAVIFLCVSTPLRAEEESQPVREETMLMFVGEEIDVLTIASRREQSAWQAPAIARVLTQEKLRNRGTYTSPCSQGRRGSRWMRPLLLPFTHPLSPAHTGESR